MAFLSCLPPLPRRGSCRSARSSCCCCGCRSSAARWKARRSRVDRVSSAFSRPRVDRTDPSYGPPCRQQRV